MKKIFKYLLLFLILSAFLYWFIRSAIGEDKAMRQAVIITATGDLDRAGFCDFLNDGSFDRNTETIITNPPYPWFTVSNDFNTVFHRWDGTNWVEIVR